MRIARVEAIPVRLRRHRESALGTAGSPTTLAQAAGDYRWSDVVGALYSVNFETALIKVTTDRGMTGWGEAQAPLAPEIACEIVRRLLAPVLAGEHFDGSGEAVEGFWDRMYQSMRVRGQTGGFMLDAISGVDVALWDLAGRMQNRPVAALIGGELKERVPAYWSGIEGAGVGDAAQNARTAWHAGFRAFKLFHDREPESLLTRMDAIAGALGPDARIAVDALWRLDPATAPLLGRDLDRRNTLWLEAPLPPEDPAAHKKLARAIRTPLAIGESYRTVFELAPFLRERVAAFIQPDLGRCGITGFLRIAKAAREAGAEVVPHLSIALAPQIGAAIHAAAAVGAPWLEYNPKVLEIANRYTPVPLAMDGAAYLVPRGPGLGIDVDEDRLRADIVPVRV